MRARYLRHAFAAASLAAAAGVTSVASPPAVAADTELNVYNWSD